MMPARDVRGKNAILPPKKPPLEVEWSVTSTIVGIYPQNHDISKVDVEKQQNPLCLLKKNENACLGDHVK